MSGQDEHKSVPKHMSMMALDQARELVKANKGSGKISVTYRKNSESFRRTICSHFELILTLRMPTDDVRGLGTLATTVSADESDKNALAHFWESELDLGNGILLDFDALLAHIRACKDRRNRRK